MKTKVIDGFSPDFRIFTPWWVKEEERRLLSRTAAYSSTQTEVTESGIRRKMSAARDIGIEKFNAGTEEDSNRTVPLEVMPVRLAVALQSVTAATMAARVMMMNFFMTVMI